MKVSRIIGLILIAALLVVPTASFAQVSYPEPAMSSYQVVNLDPGAQTIDVDYYNNGGIKVHDASYPNVAGNGGVVTVQQALETSLPSGELSAVISSGGPLAAIVNQQLGQSGDGNSIAPFSSYSTAGSGATNVTLPAIMHNWFGYYTDVIIQNVGTGDATIDITYQPTAIGTCTTGATGQTDQVVGLKKFASGKVSQVSKTSLGAPSAAGCASFDGRFLGGATLTSNQPIVVVVNQNVQDKLFTYNGFSTSGQNLVVPVYMRNYFNYYASLTIANPGNDEASVDLTYKPGAGSNPTTDTTANHKVPGKGSITIYDGPGATATQSDLLTKYPDGSSNRFLGLVEISSNKPVVAVVNQESTLAQTNQAGSYNVPLTTEGTQEISVPLIQSNFFGYYTSLTIVSVDGTNPTVEITYTSDDTYSSKTGASKTYEHTLVSGFLNRYEGSDSVAAQSDIFDDSFWASGGTQRFLGSAKIKVKSGSNIVAVVNSESKTAPQAATRDSLYNYNAINIAP